MNQIVNKYESAREDIFSLEESFEKITKAHKLVRFKEEASYALQALKNNEYLLSVSRNNPGSLKMAITNVASIGITLAPHSKHAYLVPRKNQVCLDVSYLGFCHLAVSNGNVSWVQAEIVREKDSFKWNGLGQMPEHNYNPFSKERGEITGVYCVAKLPNGDILPTVMPIDEVYSIRDRSELWKKSQKGPWLTDEGEMIKKTVIKRAAKLWPSGNSDRLYRAIDEVNKHEGIVFKDELEEDFPIPMEEKMVGNFYRIQNGKFRGSQLKDLSREEIEEYKEVLESRGQKGALKTWEEHLLSVFNQYLFNYEHFQMLLGEEDENASAE